MLDKFIGYLKNVIFFKTIMYLLMITLLIIAMQLLKSDFQETQSSYNDAIRMLNRTKLKLNTIENKPADTILETYHKYAAILSVSEEQNCLQRYKVVRKIESLRGKYDLDHNINVKLSTAAEDDVAIKSRDPVIIKNYDVDVEFDTKQFEEAISIIEKIFAQMPENSIISAVELSSNDVLNAQVIPLLQTKKAPLLINANLHMIMRTIASNNYTAKEPPPKNQD